LTEGSAGSNHRSHLLPREYPSATVPDVEPSRKEAAMEPSSTTDPTTSELADDLLCGAHEISKFIYGRKGSRRKIYYLAEASRLPVFRIGSVLCARKSVVLGWIAGQENRVAQAIRTRHNVERKAGAAASLPACARALTRGGEQK
jgi:hypothetical protein